MTPSRLSFVFLAVIGVFTSSFTYAEGIGVDVGNPSIMRNLVPAAPLERQAETQYGQLKQQAAQQGALVSNDNPQTQRLRKIADHVIPFTNRWNPRSKEWKWEISLIKSKQINAFCMPGGKIAFYTGILDTLHLNDDEVAIIMGHEIAHALREHARERMAKTEITNLGARLLGTYFGDGKYSGIFSLGGNLLNLKFSRSDETEADIIGLDLAARAGFDPRNGVTLWEKMSTASSGAPPQWLSTHPAGKSRIQEIKKYLPKVMPLYEQAHSEK
ncbi:metalloendopeptidase OMA1, mitochondrial [Gammaproteobacteria bacterium]